MKTRSVGEILGAVESRAPASTAESWDNVGLLVGDADVRTATAVISVDLTEQALAAARRAGAKVIINHHPCIFPRQKGLASVTASAGGVPGLVYRALRDGISVIACHTNFDRCALEVVHAVAGQLGAVPRGRLHEHGELLKLVVFVPTTHVSAVRESLADAGAGHIGNYDSCAFAVAGQGTFRGGSGTQPFIGTPGRLARVQEVRVETVLPRGLQGQVLQALREAHPYEEIAYDLYAVEQAPGQAGLIRGLGYGFWADLPQPVSFAEMARRVKRAFQVDGFLLTDPAPRRVRRIAFAAGKGESVLRAAQAAGCDLFITGEAGYHGAVDARLRGMAVMELGHRESERFFLATMEGWLRALGLRTRTLNVPQQRIWSDKRFPQSV